MLTPEDAVNTVQDLQEQDLEKNNDYQILKQQETHLNKILSRQDDMTTKLQLLYEKLDAVKNYQEFTDLLANNTSLLREIFTKEKAQRNQAGINQVAPRIDWSKYGFNIEDYIAEDDELTTLQNDGLL
ncbi:hypothetical protein C6P44_003973 [Monosporozyma unispora]|nr:hypothetical protein C6P44_003973 [Kazachstania unispora]